MFKTEVQSTAILTETASRPASSLNLTEIAGYQLEKRIGVGGFGEVWRAIGPGGFLKAVKILFGNLTGPQAETELKSLSRMRELRHPFLLNLERVEVADGRVIVVSELADRSLDDRFKEAVNSGLRGIPRDELVGYLRDAADALDFMSEQHGLQHLDIKPENLLLQGNHAKVGDFGLTKSLAASGHSLVNGFTPLYAPPELFDGRPDRGSDQYSLAIVYQIMLTGTPPFNGRSPAQLTSQHLKSAPDLSSLHPSDRAVVARALSKNPKTRFASCRQFVDELAKRRYASSSLPKATSHDALPLETSTALVDSGTLGIQQSKLMPPVVPLRPPAGLNRDNWFIRPTVFVGIGGLGTRAVELLQERFGNHFPEATLPSFCFVCADADVESLEAVRQRTQPGLKSKFESIRMPLRSSHEYRKVSSDHLSWLSRRWLFNIPRSGKVEGMRPLGRLAFVDHEDTFRSRIEKCLESIFQADAAKTTAQQTQLPCSLDGVDFVLIGATSGGTSSGCLLDAAWCIKSVLAEKRLPPSQLSGFLLHGTSHGRQFADIQDANTLSFLKELQYFSLPGVQRPAAKGRSADANAVPFDSAWMLHLGDDLTTLEYNAGLQSLTEYLELRTLTPARCDMEAWQAAETQLNGEERELQLRTFGLSNVASDTWEMANGESGRMCASLIHRWVAGSNANVHNGPGQFSPELTSLITELSLTSEGVINLMPQLLNPERSRRIDDYAASLPVRINVVEVKQDLPELVATLLTQDTTSNGQANALTTVIEGIRRDLTAGLNQSYVRIERHISQCLDGRGRCAAAEQDLEALVKSIDNAIVTSTRQKTDLQHAFSDLCSNWTRQPADPLGIVSQVAIKSFCRQYCMLLVCQTVCQNINTQLKSLKDHVARIEAEQIKPLKARILALSAKLGATNPPVPEPLLEGFDAFLLSGGRFQLSAMRNRESTSADVALLTSLGANFLFVGAGGPAAEHQNRSPESFPASCRPFLRNVGGGQRVLAVLPSNVTTERWRSTLVNEFGQCVSLCSAPRQEITVVCETEGIALSTLQDSLTQLRPVISEIAERVHSRQDIQW